MVDDPFAIFDLWKIVNGISGPEDCYADGTPAACDQVHALILQGAGLDCTGFCDKFETGKWTLASLSASGVNGSFISFYINFTTPCANNGDVFCLGRENINLFQYFDTSETKRFSFDTSFQNTVAVFARNGIVPSEFDNRYNFLHDFSLRDSESICSFRVDLNPRSGQGGAPTTGTIHIDSINPNTDKLHRISHGAVDLYPDMLRKLGLPIPTG